jgi:hypothetical protein
MGWLKTGYEEEDDVFDVGPVLMECSVSSTRRSLQAWYLSPLCTSRLVPSSRLQDAVSIRECAVTNDTNKPSTHPAKNTTYRYSDLVILETPGIIHKLGNIDLHSKADQ